MHFQRNRIIILQIIYSRTFCLCLNHQQIGLKRKCSIALSKIFIWEDCDLTWIFKEIESSFRRFHGNPIFHCFFVDIDTDIKKLFFKKTNFLQKILTSGRLISAEKLDNSSGIKQRSLLPTQFLRNFSLWIVDLMRKCDHFWWRSVL